MGFKIFFNILRQSRYQLYLKIIQRIKSVNSSFIFYLLQILQIFEIFLYLLLRLQGSWSETVESASQDPRKALQETLSKLTCPWRILNPHLGLDWIFKDNLNFVFLFTLIRYNEIWIKKVNFEKVSNESTSVSDKN